MSEHKKARDILENVAGNLRVTGIGSVPFMRPDEACAAILESCPCIPYVPQLIKYGPRENMFVQFSEHLPCLKADYQKKKVVYDGSVDREKALAEFYDYVAYDCYDYFAMGPRYSIGFSSLLDACACKDTVRYIKTQITGPVTYLLAVSGEYRQPLIIDDELADAVTIGLAMKGLWQAREIRKAGKKPLLFFDEPSLWGLGSAYMPVSVTKARARILALIDFIRERDPDVVLGLHCCGNSDWTTGFDAEVDIVSFDAYGFGDKVALYYTAIEGFLQRGGVLSLGIVPTSEYREEMTEEELYRRFVSVMERFAAKGLSQEDIMHASIFTPSCGMGPLPVAVAKRIMELTASLADKIHHQYAGTAGTKRGNDALHGC